jgi:hypothetical protein
MRPRRVGFPAKHTNTPPADPSTFVHGIYTLVISLPPNLAFEAVCFERGSRNLLFPIFPESMEISAQKGISSVNQFLSLIHTMRHTNCPFE